MNFTKKMSKKIKNSLSVVEAAEKKPNQESKNEIYILDELMIKEGSEINSAIDPIKESIAENLNGKIKESFSGLNEKYHHLAAITFGDLEHSYGGNRLFIKSKIIDAIKEGKEFSYASYDINGMGISNDLSKSLGNLRILELSYISHEIVKYLKNSGYNETFFSRNGGDEFSIFTTAPDYILKNAFDYGRKKELGKLRDVLKDKEYDKILIEVRDKKGGKNEKEWLSKISGFTVGINSYDFNGIKVENFEDEYKKITTGTDEFMEHYKSGRLKDKYISSLMEYIDEQKISDETKYKIFKIIKKLSLERNYQKNKKDELDRNSETTESQEIRKLLLDKEIENTLVTKIEGFFGGEDQIIIGNYTGKFKTGNENTLDSLNFIESNELSDQQNKNFAEIGKKLEKKIKKEFYKLTKKRNGLVEKFKLSEKDSQELDYYLGKAKFKEEEINKIKEIINISEEEIQELKVEYIRALFMRGHYTGSYQPQAAKVITEKPEETGFNIENKIVIDSPSFKSINELCGHTNGDYFLMKYVKHMKDEMMETFNEFGISKEEFGENVVIISKGPNTEIFIKDKIVKNNKGIKEKFKDKIKKSNFLEEFNKEIGKDENLKTLLDKRIDFIKNNQKEKFFDIKKEIILLEMGKNLQENIYKKYGEILSEYKKSYDYNMEKIDFLTLEKMKKKINTFNILK